MAKGDADGPYVVVERWLKTRRECAPRVLCKTVDGLVIAVCGTPGHMENLDCVRQAELPFTMTVEPHALLPARMQRVDLWVPWNAVVKAGPEACG